MGKTETGAGKVKKEPIERCYFDSIDLQVKEQTIKIYNSQAAVREVKNIYVISNDKGKKLQVNVTRKNADKCLNKNKHSLYSITKTGEVKSNSINQKELTVFYEKISEEHLDASFLYYFFLPISDKAGRKHLLKFDSCKEHPQCNVITYPDIEYNVTFGIDFGEFDPKKPEKKKEKLYAKFSSVYNGKKFDSWPLSNMVQKGNFTKAFEISSEKIEPAGPSDLKKRVEAWQKVCKTFELFLKGEELVSSVTKFPSPVKFVVKKPNFALDLRWNYVTSEDCLKIGRKIRIKLQAKPLVGIQCTIDLLQIALNLLTPGLGTLIATIRDFAKEGIGAHNQKGETIVGASVDVRCDLVFKGDLNISVDDIEINTAEFNKSDVTPLKGEGKIGVELVASATGKLKILCFEAAAGASAKGAASVTGCGNMIVEDGVFLDMYMNFDGLKVITKIHAEAGLKSKKINYTNENEFILLEKKEKVFGFDKPKELLTFK